MNVFDSACPEHRAAKVGRRIALTTGVVAEIVVATASIFASGTIWLREHWLDSVVGVMMWSIVAMLFGILYAGIVESRVTRKWMGTICCLILFLAVATFLIRCRIDIDCYLRPIVISLQDS